MDRDGKFYIVDKNGKVRTTNAATFLPEAPEGWHDKKLSWGKSVTYLGLTRTFSVPLKFIKDGAVILRYLRYNFGIQAYCRVVILKQNKSFGGGMIHEDYYGGEVDFSKWTDEDDTVTTEIKDAGPASNVKANEGTAYLIPYKDDARAISVKLDGIFLHETHNWIIPAGLTGADHIVGTQFVSKEGSAFGFASFSVFTISAGSFDFTTSNDYFAATFQAITGIRLKGSVKFTHSEFVVGTGHLKLMSSLGQAIELGSYSGPGLKEITFDILFDAASDEKFFLFNDMPGTNAANYQETTLSITFQSKYKTTFTKAFHLKDVFSSLMEKLNGAQVATLNSILELTGKTTAIVLASGDALRGFESAKLRTSWADCFKSTNVHTPCGFAIDKLSGIDTAILEDPSYFFGSNILTDLGEVTKFVKNNADDWMGNKISIGYPNQDYDEVNGRDEFNVTQVYTTPITKLVKEIEMISAYRADAFGVEYTRINLEGKTTTDSDSDNAVFMLLIDLTNQNVDGSYNLYRGPFTSLTGVLSPGTVFNVPLSPKTCLYKHGSRWRSVFYRYETEKLQFQTSDKNAELQYTLGGSTYTEKADAVIGNFSQAPKWLPYIFQFQTQVPKNLVAIMEGPAKYGIFQFEWRGKTLYGYVLEVSQQPADDSVQTWKLLCSSMTNINDLIYA
jgi:hypothetical protein